MPVKLHNLDMRSPAIGFNILTAITHAFSTSTYRRACVRYTLYSSDAMMVLASMGSSGNSAMRRPSLVSSPRSFSAPSAYNCTSAAGKPKNQVTIQLSWHGMPMTCQASL